METWFFEGLKGVCLVEYQDNCFGFILSKKCYVDLAFESSSNLIASTEIEFFITG